MQLSEQSPDSWERQDQLQYVERLSRLDTFFLGFRKKKDDFTETLDFHRTNRINLWRLFLLEKPFSPRLDTLKMKYQSLSEIRRNFFLQKTIKLLEFSTTELLNIFKDNICLVVQSNQVR